MSGEAYWLPIIFTALMGLSLLVYAVLDGYDLGVGILLPGDSEADRDIMIASIGPFWDANETWLVLGVGLLLIAFPAAHSLILYHVYIPVTLMLAGLILRGVAFDFRTKAPADHKRLWDRSFQFGSLLATTSQGFILGLYVMGFESSLAAYFFATLSAICVTAGYSFIGAAWLILKTEGKLQQRAIRLTRRCGWLTALGIVAVSLVNPLISPEIFERWFAGGYTILLLLIPTACLVSFIVVDRYLRHCPYENDFGSWIPLASITLIYLLCFIGLGYSFYPYIVPGQMTIWQAAAQPEALWFLLWGALIVLPTILGYTVFAYRVFWGKATHLTYY